MTAIYSNLLNQLYTQNVCVLLITSLSERFKMKDLQFKIRMLCAKTYCQKTVFLLKISSSNILYYVPNHFRVSDLTFWNKNGEHSGPAYSLYLQGFSTWSIFELNHLSTKNFAIIIGHEEMPILVWGRCKRPLTTMGSP